MRDLTTTEMNAISGGETNKKYETNWWRVGFDITSGGLAGIILGGIYGIQYTPSWDFVRLLFSPIVGGGIGLAGGAAIAAAREIYNHYA